MVNFSSFNFNDRIRKIPQKSISSAMFSREKLAMIKLEITNAEYSGVAAYPYKYLPVMTIADERRHGGKEGIVLPKGTVVSLVTNQTTIATYGSTVPVPTGSGTIPQYLDQLNNDALVTAPIDASFFGYDDSITALLVPANGGAQSTIPYSTLDDEIGLWSASTDSDLIIGANLPMGIVERDVYQDIRGAYLNYQTHDAYSTVIEGRMWYPFVNTSIITDFGSDADVATPAGSAYEAVWRKWSFLAGAGSAALRSGTLVKSDLYGKLVIEGTSATQSKTVQSVGKIITTDCRFPKDLSGAIQNYEGMTLLGVNTGGIPTDLYLFAYDVLTALGQSNNKADIVARIQNGAFGYARVQLLKG